MRDKMIKKSKRNVIYDKKYTISEMIMILGISIIIVGVPLTYTGDIASFFWWSTPKLAIFLSGLLLMLVGWGIDLSQSKTINLPGPLSKPLFLMVITITAATLLGGSLYSVTGLQTPSRGLLVQLLLFVFFVISYDIFVKVPYSRKLIISILIGGGTVVSMIALYQGAVLGWNRAASTMGNPVFLAAYTVMVIWFALARLIKHQDSDSKVIYFLIVVWLIAGLVLSYTRSGWLSFLISSAVFFIPLRKTISSSSKKTITLFLAGIIFLSVAVVSLQSFRTNRINKPNQFAQRVQQTITDKSKTRIELWKSTLHMVSEKPFIGFGADSFDVYSPKYLTEGLLKSEFTGNNIEMFYLDPHNLILKQMSEAGVFGLSALLWFIICFFYVTLKKFKNSNGKNIVMIAAAASAASYLVNLFFQPDFFETGAVALLSIAIAVSYLVPKNIKIEKTYISLFMFIIICFLIIAGALQVVSDLYYQKSFSGDYKIDERNCLVALKITPYRTFYLGHLSDIYLRKYSASGSDDDLKNAIKFSELGLDRDKATPLFHILISRSYLELGMKQKGRKYLLKSLAHARTAQRMYPSHPQPKSLVNYVLNEIKKLRNY